MTTCCRRIHGWILIDKQDAMGLKTSFVYDGAGRKIKEIIDSRITSYTYDDRDRVIKIDYPLDSTEIFTYDNLNRITSKTFQDNQGNLFGKETYAYDILGNQIEKNILQDFHLLGKKVSLVILQLITHGDLSIEELYKVFHFMLKDSIIHL